ncbi:ABC transporter permease [Anaerorhabdus furcosa]|uniref:Multidrug/hemolysin transport system permease protein n=1 Tax=Anaerorhabdus furcosa TaxID=118967 RepID=A0A1T4NYJ7_9FIRM|nr:ABC transporter permease [Anaerorhabdus furcosa]SJZ84354.1 multidrug/hemolysin transport system permease protein [Anaerorhabdus furcosa]
MINLAIRNCKIYFRQKSTVFFSLMGVFIIILLYAVFLGDQFKRGLDVVEVDILMYSWVIAGIVAVTSITTTMGAFELFVEDRAHNISKDFNISPVAPYKLVGGYILCAFIVGSLMSLVAFIVGEIFLLMQGATLLSVSIIIQIILVILLSSLMSSTIIFFIVSFFNNLSAMSTASTILGTLIGFLTGVYLPIGSVPEYVQMMIKCFPTSHTAVLLRQLFLQEPLKVSFNNLPVEYLNGFNESVGVVFKFGSFTVEPIHHILFMIAVTILFFFLAILNLSRKNK